MPLIDFVFFDAGGGHRAAATALEMAIRQQQLPWQIRPTNLQELLDPLDPVKKLSGVRIQDAYNLMLRRGWTLGSARILRLLQLGIRASHRPMVRALSAHWRDARPDMVVSFVPNFNRALRESFHAAFPGRPYVTILTDLADYPPHFWIERQSQDFICGTRQAAAQAGVMGHPAGRVFRVSGMILHPRFYGPSAVDRAAGRRRLGLHPGLATGLVLFGGHGSKAMLDIAARLDRSRLSLQLIFICGRNQALAHALRSKRLRLPHHVEGFTTRVNEYMRLADFFIGKPGPGSLSEALAMRLPVIVVRNAWTLPQERYNADWVLENEVGIALAGFRQIAPAVARLIVPETLARFQTNAAKLENRAVFEIPAILARILARNAAAAPPPLRASSAPLG